MFMGGGIILALMSGCSKSENQNAALENPQEKAVEVMTKIHDQYESLNLEQLSSTLREKNEVLELIYAGKAKTNALGDVPLGDVFYVHEGLLNANNANFYDPITGEEEITSTFTVDVYQDSQNDYYIETADFIPFYNDLQAAIDLNIDEADGEVLIIAYLELISLSNAEATFVLHINPGVVQAPWYTPPGSLPAYSNASGGDAADLLRAYTNQVHGFFNKYPCPPGTQPYASSNLSYHTFSNNSPLLGNQYTSFVLPNIWRSNTNTNIGDDNDQTNNNQIWYSWYAKMDNLVSVGTPIFQSYGNRHFYRTDYKSYSPTNQPLGMSATPPENFYHSGRFFYPICGCF